MPAERAKQQKSTTKKAVLKGTKSAAQTKKKEKPIGVVTHFFGNIQVMIVRFTEPVSVGTAVRVKGATTDFTETISSMQFDHKPIDTAAKRQEVGIKVSQRVREGDEVYRA